MISFLGLLIINSVVGLSIWGENCPAVVEPPMEESAFMEQYEFECPGDLFGKIYYTCYGGVWRKLEECRCKYEVDEYGFQWWGSKVNKTETIVTSTGSVSRICQSSGWGDYFAQDASKCKGFNNIPDTNRGDSVNMCVGEGDRSVLCNPAGGWSVISGSCYCPAEDGWERTEEGQVQTLACGESVATRRCNSGGVWGEIDNSACGCPSETNFAHTSYGEDNTSNRCDNGVVVRRPCSAEGVWGSISYDGVCKCTTASGTTDGFVGDYTQQVCSFGEKRTICNDVGRWEEVVNTCACAADGVWEQAALGTIHEKTCANGGVLKRSCNANGYWGNVENFNCKCPAEGVWADTPAGSYASAGCSNGYIRRLCGADGKWTDIYDNSACFCSPESGWPLTPVNQLANKACPAGEQTRLCQDFGVWGDVDSSNCMCEALDGFEATALNTYATTPCVDANGEPDATHTQTRFCNGNGEWGPLDQTQCPVKWCPTVDGWYKVPVSNRPTLVTLGCMSGERWRYCNVNGEWGEVNSENCNCKATVNEVEQIIRPGESYSLPCSLGSRTYTCNANTGYFDSVDNSQCLCAGDGRFPNTVAGNLASVSCSSGVSTRLCSALGEWNNVDNSQCFCEADGIWDRTPLGSTVSVLCDAGFRRRECDDYGYWKEADVSTCQCKNEDYTVALGAQNILECDQGSIIYSCEDGHMSAPDTATCFCSSFVENGHVWNVLAPGQTTSPLVCMNGVSLTRTCSTAGNWEELDTSSCTCTAEDGWEAVSFGEYAFQACPGEATGQRKRMCLGNKWGIVDESECFDKCAYTQENGETQYVAVGETVDLPCYQNFNGTEQYKCVLNEETGLSDLVLLSSTCVRLSCVSEVSPYIVNVGDYEVSSCIDGFDGTRRRQCLPDLTFGEYVDECEIRICPKTTVNGFNFPAASAGYNSSVSCDLGYHGSRTLLCNLDGTWATEVVEECTWNTCPEEDNWPETSANATVTIDCDPKYYTGTWTRQCLISGEWEPLVVPETCIPVAPTLKALPYEGMTHVSRAPSVALFSSFAIQAPYSDCTVSIKSVENAEETYSLVVNENKTSLKGRYENGGVFADFTLPENADVHDMANYLRYGEYKVIFPSCWKAFNNAPVPEQELEIHFHTAPVPPSAPANIRLVYGVDSFSVTFDTPLYVDEPYPVTAYYLAFQPPVYPEVRIDATSRTFGPFKYIPSDDVSLLLRAENAFGLSSPDCSVEYSFHDILMDHSDIIVELDAPILHVASEIRRGNNVDVAVSVEVPPSMIAYADHLSATCNNYELGFFTTRSPLEYTFPAAPGQILSIACSLSLAGSESEKTVLPVEVTTATTSFGAVAVSAEEMEAQVVKLTWEAPSIISDVAIQSYIVQCSRDEEEFGPAMTVTALQAIVGVSAYMPGPVTCRVSASSSFEVMEDAAWGTVTIENLHTVVPSDLAVELAVDAHSMAATVTSTYCVAATGRVLTAEGKVIAEKSLVCEETNMVASFYGLDALTSYVFEVEVPTLSYTVSKPFTTVASHANDMTLTVMENYVTESSAVINVALSSPEKVICVGSTVAISTAAMVERVKAGEYKDMIYDAGEALSFPYVLVDLMPYTEYTVICVTTQSYSAASTEAFRTAADATSIQIVSIEAVHEVSSDFAFSVMFNNRVEADSDAKVQVSCGGVAVTYPLTATVDGAQAVMTIPDVFFPTDAACAFRFASLSVFHGLRFVTEGTQLLSLTPFPDEQSYFMFHVSNDSMSPVLTSVEYVNHYGPTVHVATLSEDRIRPTVFDYQVQCVLRGQSTINRVFSTQEHPVVLKSGLEATNGYVDVYFYTGYLAQFNECQVKFDSDAVKDAAGNKVTCNEVDGQCVINLVSGSLTPEIPYIALESITPASDDNAVPQDAPVVFTWNRDMVAVKPVTFRCLECETPIVSLEGECTDLQCTFVNPAGWEADHTYYVMYDAATFKAAFESDDYFYTPSGAYHGFTTTVNVCNMGYITEDWNYNCSCVNTGTHCQCNCGATAILKAF